MGTNTSSSSFAAAFPLMAKAFTERRKSGPFLPGLISDKKYFFKKKETQNPCPIIYGAGIR